MNIRLMKVNLNSTKIYRCLAASALLLGAYATLSASDLLTVKGPIDTRDLLTLAQNPEIRTLDLSGADISELSTPSPLLAGRSWFAKDALPPYVFFHAAFSDIILPAGLKSIGTGALSGAALTAVIIPDGVTEIGDYAFYGCPNLESVTIPASVTHIGKGAFGNCPRLVEVNASACRVALLPEACFEGDIALQSLHLPSVQKIGSKAFAGTAITELSLPGVAEFAPYALADMPKLEKITLNPQAKYAEGVLMNDPALVSVVGAPADIPTLFAANSPLLSPTDAFDGASTLGDFAFANSSASELILMPGLSGIGKGTFAGAGRISHIDATALGNEIPSVTDDAFSSIDPTQVKVKVNNEALPDWQQHPVWSTFNLYSDQSTGIAGIDAANAGINILVTEGNLTVTSPEPLTSLHIYDTAGSLLLNALPGSNTTNADGLYTVQPEAAEFEALPHGVLIVSAKSASLSKSTKLIK